MGTILLYDPLIMGHHLVYAENFTDWALSRGLRVCFCGYHYRQSLFYRRFSEHPQVEFLELDARLFAHRADFSGLAEELGETAFYYDRLRPLLFDDDGPAIQVEFIRSLQRRLRPELTLILYGDEMWSAWEDMARNGGAFESPTFLWLLYAGGQAYDPHGLHAQNIRAFLGEQNLFAAVATSDEYQAGRYDLQGGTLRYVPDPYCRLAGAREMLTGDETRLGEDLDRFLESGDRPILLVPGLLEARKNAAWLLELAKRRDDFSLLILGRKNLPEAVEQEAEAVFERLEARGRLFTLFSYVPECFLACAMASPKVRMLPLPYRRHDISSGIHLMALRHGLPCLVPDNGLMARRTLEHGLGEVFSHESAAAFFEAAARCADPQRPAFAPACASFMAHFSQEAFFAGADRLFGLTPGTEPDPLVRAAAAHDAALLRREPRGVDASAWLLHKALLLREMHRFEESLACLEQARNEAKTATRPVYLRGVFLEELGRAGQGYALLNGLLRERPDHPDVAAWIDAVSDAVVKHTPEGQSHAGVLARLQRDCGDGPLFPALLEVLSDRVWYHIDRGRHQLVERILRAVLEVEPEHVKSMIILAMNRMRADRLAEALAGLESLLSNGLLPEPVDRPGAAAWIDAVSDAVVKYLPEGESHAGVLARLRQGCGDGPLFPALIDSLSDRVWCHIEQRRHRLAESILLTVLGMEPEHAVSKYVFAMNRMCEGRLAEAAAGLERLVESDPGNVEYLRARADVWAQMGRLEQAAEAFADLARGCGCIPAYLHLSDVLRNAGRFDEASAALEQGFGLGACTEGVRLKKAARIEAARLAGAVKPRES